MNKVSLDKLGEVLAKQREEWEANATDEEKENVRLYNLEKEFEENTFQKVLRVKVSPYPLVGHLVLISPFQLKRNWGAGYDVIEGISKDGQVYILDSYTESRHLSYNNPDSYFYKCWIYDFGTFDKLKLKEAA